MVKELMNIKYEKHLTWKLDECIIECYGYVQLNVNLAVMSKDEMASTNVKDENIYT